jgi:hypothetical protein
MKRRLLLKSGAVVLAGMLGLGLSARPAAAALNPCIIGCCICVQDDCTDWFLDFNQANSFCQDNCPQGGQFSACEDVDDGSCGPGGPWLVVMCNTTH